jgi:hypothetical protein
MNHVTVTSTVWSTKTKFEWLTELGGMQQVSRKKKILIRRQEMWIGLKRLVTDT